MEIKDVRIEFVDKPSRLVLKKMVTDEGDFYNRENAISKQIYGCERKRENHDKSVFNNSHFQTFHVLWNSKEEEWISTGMLKAKEHAEKYGRIFVPYKQRTESQWDKLTWDESKKDVQEFINKSDIVPFPVPIRASLDELKENKKEAMKLLKPNQKLITIISSKHINTEEFPKIIKEEIKNSLLYGICCYRLGTSLEINNLSVIASINSEQKEGDKSSFVIYFDLFVRLRSFSNIAGSFAYSLFGGDVFSEKLYDMSKMPYGPRDDLLNKKLNQHYLYNPEEKIYSKSLPQKKWYGFDVVNNFLEKVSVVEGLSSHQVIKWMNYYLEQEDLRFINNLLVKRKNILESLKDYTGWSVFLNTKFEKDLSLQKSLSEF